MDKRKELQHLTDIQYRLFENMCILRDILDKHEIKYFLAWGTMLGAVRHNGFIPWDDDIDIHIMMEDLPKLREAFKSETGRLSLHDFTTHPDYPYSFTKIVDDKSILKEKEFEHLNYTCGAYIDVFPLVVIPDSVLWKKIITWQKYFFYGIIRYYNMKQSHFKWIHKIVKSFISLKWAQKKLEKNLNSKRRIGQMVTTPTHFLDSQAIEKSVFEKAIDYQFEGEMFKIPSEYDKYLKVAYGDYLQLPPEKDRVSNHDFIFTILN